MAEWRKYLDRLGIGKPTAPGPPVPERWKGVSAWHLWWELPPGHGPLAEVSAIFEVLEEPRHDQLYFWALQASFHDGAGRSHGAAHLGLQWYSRFPDHRAANWGGYAAPPNRGVLAGTENALPGFADQPNTRTYAWRAGTPYRLSIRHGATGWAGEITDRAAGQSVVMRELLAGGDRLAAPVVWAEIFAPCEAPRTVVRWSGMEAVTAAGRRVPVDRVRLTLPGNGNCPNTDVAVDEVGVLQIAGTDRSHRDGDRLRVPVL